MHCHLFMVHSVSVCVRMTTQLMHFYNPEITTFIRVKFRIRILNYMSPSLQLQTVFRAVMLVWRI